MSIAGEDSETDEMDVVEGGDSTVASPPAKKQKGKATASPTAGNKRSSTNSILRCPTRSEPARKPDPPGINTNTLVK